MSLALPMWYPQQILTTRKTLNPCMYSSTLHPYTPLSYVNAILPQALPYALPQLFFFDVTIKLLLSYCLRWFSCTWSFSSMFVLYICTPCCPLSQLSLHAFLIPMQWDHSKNWYCTVKERIKVINQKRQATTEWHKLLLIPREMWKLDTGMLSLCKHHLLFCKGIGTKTGAKLWSVILEAGCYLLDELTKQIPFLGAVRKAHAHRGNNGYQNAQGV